MDTPATAWRSAAGWLGGEAARQQQADLDALPERRRVDGEVAEARSEGLNGDHARLPVGLACGWWFLGRTIARGESHREEREQAHRRRCPSPPPRRRQHMRCPYRHRALLASPEHRSRRAVPLGGRLSVRSAEVQEAKARPRTATVRAVLLSWPAVMMPSGSGTMPPS